MAIARRSPGYYLVRHHCDGCIDLSMMLIAMGVTVDDVRRKDEMSLHCLHCAAVPSHSHQITHIVRTNWMRY